MPECTAVQTGSTTKSGIFACVIGSLVAGLMNPAGIERLQIWVNIVIR